MPGLIGKKIGMTSVFSADGKNIPCTVIEAGPCVVTQVKTVETDGYDAIQLAFDEKREKSTTKPLKGHFEKQVPLQRPSWLNLESSKVILNLETLLQLTFWMKITLLMLQAYQKVRDSKVLLKGMASLV